MRGDEAVEGCGDLGVAVIDLGDLGVDLRLLQIGLGIVARGGGGIERRLRDRLAGDQIRLPLEIGFRLLDRGLRARLGGLRLFELELVGLGLDREQGRALLHEAAVLVVDRFQKTLHPRNQIDGFDRGGVAGGV